MYHDNESTLDCKHFSITQLHLENYRNYQHLQLNLDKQIILLHGQNGAGKSNLLESLSYIGTSRGMRNASLSHIDRYGSQQGWYARIHMKSSYGLLKAEIFHDRTNKRKSFLLDNKEDNPISKEIKIICLSPDMDNTFGMQSNLKRRLYDSLVNTLYTWHNKNINKLSHLMRERLTLLSKQRYDNLWLEAIEEQMTHLNISIAKARNLMRNEVNDNPHNLSYNHSNSHFPVVQVNIDGFVEKTLSSCKDIDEIAHILRAQYKRERPHDKLRGSTNTGVHRSTIDLQKNNILASRGSTGEQKIMLLSLLLTHAQLLMHKQKILPILLLDELASHLDDTTRHTLLECVEYLGVQCWISCTDKSSFSFPNLEYLHIHNGQIVI